MAGISTRRSPDSPDAAAFQVHLDRGRLWLAILIPIVLLASVALVRGGALGGRSLGTPFGAGAAANLSPAELTAAAADKLEAATAKGGTGYTFEIVQTSTMVARPGGPLIPVPDPVTRGTLRMADRYFLNAVIEQGVVRPDGFWSQMRAGPAEGAKPDWASARILFEALVRDDTRFRDDGDGWYEAAALPGIGLDPETAALLPDLLRGATTALDLPAGDTRVDPDAARTIGAEAKVADIPGVVAADGAAFTRLTAPLVYGFDAAGRLVSVTVSALNTNMTDFDLVIETSIVLAYDGVAGLPEPKPARSADGSN